MNGAYVEGRGKLRQALVVGLLIMNTPRCARRRGVLALGCGDLPAASSVVLSPLRPCRRRPPALFDRPLVLVRRRRASPSTRRSTPPCARVGDGSPLRARRRWPPLMRARRWIPLCCSVLAKAGSGGLLGRGDLCCCVLTRWQHPDACSHGGSLRMCARWLQPPPASLPVRGPQRRRPPPLVHHCRPWWSRWRGRKCVVQRK